MSFLVNFRCHIRNPLDPANEVQWERDIFKTPTAAELNNTVHTVNLMDIAQTRLPRLTLADLNCVALGKITSVIVHYAY